MMQRTACQAVSRTSGEGLCSAGDSCEWRGSDGNHLLQDNSAPKGDCVSRELTVVDLLPVERCTGCAVCSNVCQVQALIMQPDAMGFEYPRIDAGICTHCGLCAAACPVLNAPDEQVSLREQPQALAAWADDALLRRESSSGGVFGAIGADFVAKGGIVAGVRLNLDQRRAEHYLCTTTVDLACTRGSKYIQSHPGTIYNDVCTYLCMGRQVLFSGTPCQVAGMRRLAVQCGEADLLSTVEVICHGVPSEVVWQWYLATLEARYSSRVTDYRFRSKSPAGWHGFSTVARFSNGREYVRNHGQDAFMLAFLRNYCLRRSCYDCEFCAENSVADLTLGDFWGAPPSLDDDKGVSIAVVCTACGQALLDQCGHLQSSVVSLAVAQAGNPRLKSGHIGIPQQRDDFKRVLLEEGYDAVLERYLQPTRLSWRQMASHTYHSLKRALGNDKGGKVK